MRERKYSWPIAALGLGATLVMSLPNAASACGGFFCNRQQIDQSGEQILFSYEEDGSITTVVQIQYTGPSETFAWILPIPAEPQVSVGTDELFRQLAASTTPRFDLTYRQEGTCRQSPVCQNEWDDAFNSPERAGDPSGQQDAGAAPPSVDVRFRGNVGPYDVAVLASADADALRNWLTDNGYLIPEGAAAEMDYYVELGNFFVALRLQKDRSAGDIQPLVLRSANDEPCIPIRLTRIATVPDMPITAYFLAPRRARPLNYMLVTPDLEDTALFQYSRTYASAVTEAVDGVGGHAFATDYAGNVPQLSLEMQSVEDLRAQTDAAAFLMTLQERGFNGDSQLLGLLQRFIPPPSDVDPQSFYNCLVSSWCDEYTSYARDLAFQPSEFVDALNEAILVPRAEAQAMLDGHEHLTRLFTTMSADEMTIDPTFTLSEDLPREHSHMHTAELVTECAPEFFSWTAPQRMVFESGRQQPAREGVPYGGNDDDFCDDRREGFYQGAPTVELAAIANRRGSTAGGGARCGVSHSNRSQATLPAMMLGIGLLGLLWRRRG